MQHRVAAAPTKCKRPGKSVLTSASRADGGSRARFIRPSHPRVNYCSTATVQIRRGRNWNRPPTSRRAAGAAPTGAAMLVDAPRLQSELRSSLRRRHAFDPLQLARIPQPEYRQRLQVQNRAIGRTRSYMEPHVDIRGERIRVGGALHFGRPVEPLNLYVAVVRAGAFEQVPTFTGGRGVRRGPRPAITAFDPSSPSVRSSLSPVSRPGQLQSNF